MRAGCALPAHWCVMTNEPYRKGEDMSVSYAPTRTCIGCRQRDVQQAMLKIVRTGETGTVDSVNLGVDAHRALPGRGAWIHPSESCLAMAVKKNAPARAFKQAISRSALAAFEQAVREHIPAQDAHS